MTKEELLEYIDCDSKFEEDKAKFYIDMKGVALHIKVLKYLGFKFEGDNKIKWKTVSEKLSQDKLLRDKLYIYLATLEEYIRAYIANKYSDNVKQVFWINGTGKRNQIKNEILNDKELFDVLEEIDFGTLIQQVKNLPNKDGENLFGNKGTNQNVDAVRELRNAVSHHKFMFSYEFLKCNVDGVESNSLENNIKNLRQLLPVQYHYGENGNGGITADMKKCNINL